jgi:capsular exopolysaccharide synthesis family protein
MQLGEIESNEGTLTELLARVSDTVRRRWIMLLAVTAAVLVAGFILISIMTPKYVATAKVRLDPRSAISADAQQARAELAPEAIETELTAVRSDDLARSVVRSLGLADDAEFTGGLNASPKESLANSSTREGAVVNALLSRLAVSREKLTYVVNISFNSVDPVKAASVANAFASGYIESRTEKKLSTARAQSAWFQERLSQLGAEARTAEARAGEYRARSGLVESGSGDGGGTIADQQVAPLSGTLAAAQSDAAAARSTLAAAQGQVARGRPDSVSAVLSSSVVADLRRQRAEVLRNKSEIEQRYGERHPDSVRINEQLAQIDSQIQAEARRVVTSLQATSDSAQARVSSLRGTLVQLEGERETSVRDATVAESLEREAAAKRALYDKTSQLSLDSMQAASGAIAQAELIDRARAPGAPASPNKPLLYALALVVGLAAGAGTIGAQELFTGGFRSVEALEAATGLTVLAVVPKVGKGPSPGDLMLERPTSMFAEAFRIARTAVLGAHADASVKVIAITSSLPGEGKTTSAVCFARTLAIANARTLLLECDVRRAAVRHIVKGGTPTVGLVELLHGEATLEDVLLAGDVPNLDQILVVSPYFSAENLFGEGRMEKLLDVLRDRYDYIVLDLPPLMGLADGRLLALLADATILAVKWNSTPPSAVNAALNWLHTDGSKPVGILYTQVDPSAQSAGSLSYYSKQYSDYYQNN